MNGRRAVFLDRDGTLNEEVGYLDNLEKLKIIRNAFEAVRMINQAGLLAVVVTNQSGVARGFFDETLVRRVHGQIRSAFLEAGAVIDAFYYCPHHATEGRNPYLQACSCRKPEPGMLRMAAEEWNIDLSRSYMVGDTLRDVETGHRAGSRAILVRTGYGRDVDPGPAKPDYVAEDILEAVRWILKDIQTS